MFSFSWDVTVPFTFWAGVIGGTFLTNASHGTDQLLVQRLLTCRNLRDSQKAIITSGFIVFLQFVLFLGIGIMLYAYYQAVPRPAITTNDEIFPRFIVTTLPHGISGLVMAAIFAAAMSNLSGSLNSLASTTVIDFYQPLRGGRVSDEQLLRLSRWCTAGWGVILIAHRHHRARLGVGLHGGPHRGVHRVRADARRVPPRGAHDTRQFHRRDHRHVGRNRRDARHLGDHGPGVDLVCPRRLGDLLDGRLSRQSGNRRDSTDVGASYGQLHV